ncbi:MAG: PilZ domain-containing protein [Thermodesulfobacteriota bacterium]
MAITNRKHQRIDVQRSVILLSGSLDKITGVTSNVSLNGLLISDLSGPVDHSVDYKIEILSAGHQSIFLTGKAVWEGDGQVGIKISRYHLDGKNLLKSFIEELKATNDLIDLIDDGGLEHLFVDEKGEELKIQFH